MQMIFLRVKYPPYCRMLYAAEKDVRRTVFLRPSRPLAVKQAFERTPCQLCWEPGSLRPPMLWFKS